METNSWSQEVFTMVSGGDGLRADMIVHVNYRRNLSKLYKKNNNVLYILPCIFNGSCSTESKTRVWYYIFSNLKLKL